MPQPQDTPGRLVPTAWKRALIAIFAVAILARAATLLFTFAQPARFDYPDSQRYALVARNIAAGLGPIESPTNRTGTDPLYPLLISPAFALLTDDASAAFVWARMLNIGFGLFALAALLGLARRIAGDAAALVAGAIYAVDPILLFFNGLVLTEIPFIGLLWPAMYCLWRARQTGKLRFAAAGGALLGLGALTRSSGLPLAVLLPAVIALLRTSREDAGGGGRSARWLPTLIAWLALLAALSPAIVRNYRLLGTFVPVRTGGGATLLESLGPWADGGPGMEKVAWPPVPPDANEAQRDRIYRDAALNWAAAHPRDALRLAWVKLRRTWSITLHAPGYTGRLYDVIGWTTLAPVFVAAAVGAWRLRRRTSVVVFLLTPALLIALMHVLFVGSVRYRVPAMPGLFILAGVAVAPWIERLRLKKPRTKDANS